MSLVSYDNSDDENDSKISEPDISKMIKTIQAAPEIDETMVRSNQMLTNDRLIDLNKCKELQFNPKYEELYTPEFGPKKSGDDNRNIRKNFLTGALEPMFMSNAIFELQRKNFQVYGTANDPSIGASADKIITSVR